MKNIRKIKIIEEVAQAQFEEYLEAMDIDLDVNALDSSEKQTVKRLVRSIVYGDLSFNDDFEAVYTPWRKGSQYKEPITFHERDAATLTASDNKGKDSDAKKLYAMLGQLCRVHPATFSKLVGTDIKTCEALGALLIA